MNQTRFFLLWVRVLESVPFVIGALYLYLSSYDSSDLIKA